MHALSTVFSIIMSWLAVPSMVDGAHPAMTPMDAGSEDLRDQVFHATVGFLVPTSPDPDGIYHVRFSTIITNTKSKTMQVKVTYDFRDDKGAYSFYRLRIVDVPPMAAIRLDPVDLTIDGNKYGACDAVTFSNKVTLEVPGQKDLIVQESGTVTAPCGDEDD